MPQFLFRARDKSGQSMEDRVEAATLGQARYKLELQGLTDIEFFTPESIVEIQRMALSGTGIEAEDIPEVPASTEIAAQARRGVASQFLWALSWHMFAIGPLLLWNWLSWTGDRPFGWSDWLGFILTPLYLLFFIKLVLPLVLFNILLEAALWQDWEKQARCIRLARWLRLFMRTGLPDNELRFREAYALAAQGNLSAALLHVEQLRGHPDITEYLFLSRSASIYEHAGDYTQQLRCAEQATNKNPDAADSWIDLAMVRIRHFADVGGASAALARAEEKDLSEMAKGVLLLTKGMIAVEDKRMPEGEALLLEARAILKKFGIALIKALEAELQAYLVLALAGQGRASEAKTEYLALRPLLVVDKRNKLLSRADAALA